jgi:hypothetical protein
MCKAVVDFAKLFCVAKLGASKMLSAEFLLLKSVQKIRRVL